MASRGKRKLKFDRSATGNNSSMNAINSPDSVTSTNVNTEVLVQSNELSNKFHDFEFGLHKILTTIGKINAEDIKAFFEKLMKKQPGEIEKILPKKSKLVVFCGYHGIKEKEDFSKMGKYFEGFFNDVKSSLIDLEEDEKLGLKERLEIEELSGDIRQISLLPGRNFIQSVKSATNTAFKNLQYGNEPTVIFLLSCFSEFSDLKEFLQESGVCAVAALKNDLGIITNGKCFELDDNQGRILKEFKDDHQNAKKIGDLKTRNLYISGPFGCGKTVIIVEVCWMRICFCLRMIREQGLDAWHWQIKNKKLINKGTGREYLFDPLKKGYDLGNDMIIEETYIENCLKTAQDKWELCQEDDETFKIKCKTSGSFLKANYNYDADCTISATLNDCTFTQTGKNYHVDDYFQCLTCDMTNSWDGIQGGGHSICTTCIKICHAKHDFKKVRKGRHFCDCGEKGEKSCKALTSK